MRLLPLALAACLPQAFALLASEAGVIDWYKPFIGIPLRHYPATAPSFHRTPLEAPDKPSHSVVSTATASNVFAALHPADGSIGVRSCYARTVHAPTGRFA